MNQELETEIFRRFCAPNRKKRFLWNLESRKRRQRIFDDLRDDRYFNPCLCKKVDEASLIKKHIGSSDELYVISSEEEFDGKDWPISILENKEFWLQNEILGYNKASKKGFFINHEGWFYVLG